MRDEPYTSLYGYTTEELKRWQGPDYFEAQRTDPSPGKDIRNPFVRDHDRVLYTTAFRRLQGKTQVVTPGEADFFRTRLTHTLEVAQVARRLAEYLNFKTRWQLDHDTGIKDYAGGDHRDGWIDPDVCEAAAVLHDLGHPPFGHAGEVAMQRGVAKAAKKWGVEHHGSYEGNAQSFRMAVRSLRHTPDKVGLQLTRAVLDATLKYPWLHGQHGKERSDTKWSVYPTEDEAFRWVRKDAPHDPQDPDRPTSLKTVEAQIVEWADDITYAVHDVDDWYRAGFMPIAQLVQAGPALNHLLDELERRRTPGSGPERDDLRERVAGLFTQREAFAAFRNPVSGKGDVSDPQSDAAGEAIRRARSLLFDEFTTSVELVVRDGSEPDWPRRYRLALAIDADSRFRAEVLQDLLGVYVVDSALLATHQTGQQRVVTELFRLHAAAARDPTSQGVAIYPTDVREELLATVDKTERLRLVADFVGGMTDAYASRSYARLTGGRVPFQQAL